MRKAHKSQACGVVAWAAQDPLVPREMPPILEPKDGQFRCDKWNCVMSVEACIKRQKTAVRGRAMNGAFMSVDPYCAGGTCEQGNDNCAKMPEVKGRKILGGIAGRKRK